MVLQIRSKRWDFICECSHKLQRPQIHVATMQTLQHRAIFVKKVSITMSLIPENNENKTTRIECLTSTGKRHRKRESDGLITRFSNTVALQIEKKTKKNKLILETDKFYTLCVPLPIASSTMRPAGIGPSKSWLGPPNLALPYTVVNRFLEKIVNCMPPDVRF